MRSCPLWARLEHCCKKFSSKAKILSKFNYLSYIKGRECKIFHNLYFREHLPSENVLFWALPKCPKIVKGLI